MRRTRIAHHLNHFQRSFCLWETEEHWKSISKLNLFSLDFLYAGLTLSTRFPPLHDLIGWMFTLSAFTNFYLAQANSSLTEKQFQIEINWFFSFNLLRIQLNLAHWWCFAIDNDDVQRVWKPISYVLVANRWLQFSYDKMAINNFRLVFYDSIPLVVGVAVAGVFAVEKSDIVCFFYANFKFFCYIF